MIKFCPDCLAKEGELHKIGCDWERCPICKRQLLSCPKHNWDNLKDSEREPFFIEVFNCIRCGKIYPEMKMVSDERWKKNSHGHIKGDLKNIILLEKISDNPTCKNLNNFTKGGNKIGESKYQGNIGEI
jgi:hypothetical protein